MEWLLSDVLPEFMSRCSEIEEVLFALRRLLTGSNRWVSVCCGCDLQSGDDCGLSWRPSLEEVKETFEVTQYGYAQREVKGLKRQGKLRNWRWSHTHGHSRCLTDIDSVNLFRLSLNMGRLEVGDDGWAETILEVELIKALRSDVVSMAISHFVVRLKSVNIRLQRITFETESRVAGGCGTIVESSVLTS
jgi:hypothetical protein